MATLLEYQTQLAGAVLSGDRELAFSLFQGTETRRRLGLRVYANNLIHALVSALRDTFPVVRGILGETTFTSLAVAYARQNPPARELLLIWYGAGFPAFLDGIEVDEAPCLADVARLEYAWLEAYHAPEAVPLAPPVFATLTPEQLVAARLRLHPSVRLLHSAHDFEQIWRRHRDGLGAADTAERRDRSSSVAVLRPFAEVLVRPVSAPVFDCVARLRDGAPFGEAAGHLGQAEHLAELQALIATGLFTDIEKVITMATTATPTTTDRPSHAPTPANGIAKLTAWIIGGLGRIPDAAVQLLARLAIAPVFWLSGQTKVDGWTIKETTFELFRYEYTVPVLPPEVAAYMATLMEHALPVLLVIGLATRFAALGLLGMTLVIQLFVYPESWAVHALWGALLLVIVARGPGAWSLDHLIGRSIGVRL